LPTAYFRQPLQLSPVHTRRLRRLHRTPQLSSLLVTRLYLLGTDKIRRNTRFTIPCTRFSTQKIASKLAMFASVVAAALGVLPLLTLGEYCSTHAPGLRPLYLQALLT
jgi:hypothetical protein